MSRLEDKQEKPAVAGVGRLEEIKARLEAATPGPWECEVNADYIGIGTYSGSRSHKYDGDLPYIDEEICEFSHRCWPTDSEKQKDVRKNWWNNARLISHAPEDITLLLNIAGEWEALLKNSFDYNGICPSCGNETYGKIETLKHEESCFAAEVLGWTKK